MSLLKPKIMASWVIPETENLDQPDLKKLSLRGGPAKTAWTLFRGGKAVRLQGEYSRAMHYLNQSRSAFEKLGDEYGQACACQELAFCSGELNRNAMALEYAHQAVKKFQELGKNMELAWSYDYLSYIYFYHYRYKEALVYSRKARDLFSEEKSLRAMAWNSCNMARIHLEMGLNQEALRYYQEALAKFQKMKNEQGMALSWLGLGTVFRALCQYSQARQVLSKAREFYTKLRIKDHVGWCLLNEAALERIAGNDEKALALNIKANQYFLTMKKNDGIAWGHFQIGQIYLEQGKLIKSWESLREALNLHKDIYNHKGVGWGENELGRAYYELGELDRANDHFQNAKNHAEQYGVDPLKIEVEKNLANLEIDVANLQRAHKYIESSLGHCRSKNIGEILPDILRTSARYSFLLGDHDRAQRDLTEAEECIKKWGLVRYGPTLNLLKGELLVRQGKLKEAAGAWEKARTLSEALHQKKIFMEAELGLIQLNMKTKSAKEIDKVLGGIEKLNRIMGARKLKAKVLAVRAWQGYLATGFLDQRLTNQAIQVLDSSRQFVSKCLLLGWLRDLMRNGKNEKEAAYFDAALQQLISTGPVDLNIIHGEPQISGALPMSLII